MSANALRNLVIDKISGIEDEKLLRALKVILDNSQSSASPYKTTPRQREKIRIGLRQLKKGKTISNEELEKSEDEWLKK